MTKPKNIYAIIKDDITKTMKKLTKHGLIFNQTFTDKHSTTDRISSNSSGIMKNKPYLKVYLEEYSNRNYLFAFEDNSIVKCNYQFNYDEDGQQYISKVNLSYLPYPQGDAATLADDYSPDDFDQINELYANQIEIDYEDDFYYTSNYLRVDYSISKDDFTEFTHSKCHIHIGLNNNFRLPFKRIPLFSEFIELILFLYYPKDWNLIHLNTQEPNEVKLKEIIKRNSNLVRSDQLSNTLTEHENLAFHLYL